MTLSKEQEFALEKFKEEKNIFITGPGGTGKSFLIKEMVKEACVMGKRIHVCALTGCAAVLLQCNAKTIHSWSGIGLGNAPFDKILYKIRIGKKKKNWKCVDILVIDEVSMMSKKIFDLLDMLGRKLRNQPDKPFGGIQLVFSGDFFQLPPVGKKEDEDSCRFCFESENWKSTFDYEIELKTIFRQSDALYAKILNQIRVGRITKKSFAELQKYINRTQPKEQIVRPTLLYPTKKFVEKLNKTSLEGLKTQEKNYDLRVVSPVLMELTSEQKQIASNFTEQEREKETTMLINSFNGEQNLILKEGAQVMCVVNLDMEGPISICNGSQGIIKEFDKVDGYPIVLFNNGIERKITTHIWKSETIPDVAIEQVPLILAWALTIHKSQGTTLDLAEIDVGNRVFECGQTYVALSRVKSLEGLYLKSFDPFKIKINSKVKEYYQKLS